MTEQSVYDPTLKVTLSASMLRVLRLCPVDTFFTAQETGLHGGTLKGLYNKGYLNRETTKDGLGIEYYLNNHGHRIRRMHMDDFRLVSHTD